VVKTFVVDSVPFYFGVSDRFEEEEEEEEPYLRVKCMCVRSL
jgi:hypothetical protein